MSEPMAAEADPLAQPITQLIWEEKYRHNGEKSPEDTFLRVVNGVYAKDPSKDAHREALEAMMRRDWMPGGRIFAGAGTGKRVTWINCFHPEEKLITRDGVKTFTQLRNEGRATVLTERGWEDAEIREFGEQKVNSVCFKPATLRKFGTGFAVATYPRGKWSREVRATQDHRWILAGGEETIELKVGDLVKGSRLQFDRDDEEYKAGIVHGLIFGDGAQCKELANRYASYQLHMFGEDVGSYARLFDQVKHFPSMKAKGYVGSVYLRAKAGLYKNVPLNQTPSYLEGFIEGWTAADGGETTTRQIHSSNHQALDWLIDHAPMAGWSPIGYREDPSEETNYGRRTRKIRCVTLTKQDVFWRVQSIEALDGTVPVMCAVVPGTAAFTLAAGIYTGNCFVSPTIQDSMDTEEVPPLEEGAARNWQSRLMTSSSLGIMPALNVAAYTQQQGGGIGMCYSTIRPNGAVVARTGSVSSGVIPFMNMWNGMCGTIRSSGSRRGAMMATLHIWHPDVIDFILAKTKPGVLTNFNVSVCVTDDFMEAYRRDQEWDLGFSIPRADGKHVATYERDGGPWYVYKRIKARELFELITKTTYDYAEPGVIYMDRVNKLNNLNYCELITATNPCGEQPLPPNGDCDLGHVNLANMVLNPFTEDAEIDYERLDLAVRVGVRFLDNVLDTSPFPTEDQYEEAQSKRRIGLGYTGLGNLLQQLMVRYGSKESLAVVDDIGEHIATTAYHTSIELARERGPFPAFVAEEYLKAPFLKKMPDKIRSELTKYGIRNGVLMSLAPTGTTSIFYGNVSSGVEPSFSWSYQRDVVVAQQGDEQIKETFQVEDYGWFLYSRSEAHAANGEAPLPDYMVTALELGVEEHLSVAARAQYWIDAAISKTINCPKSMPYEEFHQVYLRAYELGMKGCTTYRPSGTRGAVLKTDDEAAETAPAMITAMADLKRPPVLSGITHRIHWPLDNENYYLTINHITDEEGKRRPFEIFISTKSPEQFETMTALTRAVSAICRRGDATFLFEELMQIHSPAGGTFFQTQGEAKPQYTPSLISAIGRILLQDSQEEGTEEPEPIGDKCIQCKKMTLVRQEGCLNCSHCGFSKCG